MTATPLYAARLPAAAPLGTESEGRMSPHKFSLGQTVTVRAGAAEGHIPSGTYTISRILPGDDFDRSYRAKHVGDGHERVLREKQIEAHD